MSQTKDTIWKSTEVSRKYLEGVRGSIPLANEQIQILQRILKKACPNAKNFLDLGCGDGILGMAALDIFPHAKGVFMDFSPKMIESAKEKISSAHTIILQDYKEKDWKKSIKKEKSFDIIISGFSIHHQTDQRKRELYSEIFDLLSPGGFFLNLEHIASHSSFGEELFEEMFLDSMMNFYKGEKTRKEIEKDFYSAEDREANILATTEKQCDWLRDIGFTDVDCFFKVFELALFGGRKK